MKHTRTIALLSVLSLLLVSALAYAGEHKKKDLDDKLMCKIKFALENEKELDLSEQQVDDLKELKINLKKELVRKKADIKLIKIDIYDHLYKDPVDVAAIDPLIDQKYELKKQKAKYIVQSYANFKKIVSDDQKETFKELYRKDKDEKEYMEKCSKMYCPTQKR